MIIKNKEERSESIWRFAAVAAIPLLLLFIAGFSLGDTSGKEKAVNKKDIELVRSEKAAVEARLVLLDSFFLQGDGILSELETKMSEFDRSFRAATEENNVNSLMSWDSDVNEYFQRLRKRLTTLGIKFSPDGNMLTGTMQTGMKYFEEAIKLQEELHNRRYGHAKSQMEAGKLSELEQLEASLKKQTEELAAQTKVQQTETTVQELKLQLANCNQKLEMYAKNKEAAILARAEINDVQKNMLPQIGDKNWKNDTKFLNDLRTKISNSLTIANTHLNTIQ